MRAIVRAHGLCDQPGYGEADVIIVNTCSFLTVATQEGIQTILELAQVAEKSADEVFIIVAGCIPSRYPIDELKALLPEVDAFVKVDEEDGIVEVIERLTGVMAPCHPNLGTLRTVEAAYSYVKISEGCNRTCSFCAIPQIRGAYVSREPDQILGEIDTLLKGGVREIILVGQDTSVWGRDLVVNPADEERMKVALPQRYDLIWLLKEVAKRVHAYGGWTRILYLQPDGVTDELIDTLATTPGLLPYIDMPIQHCEQHILKSMRRSGSRESLIDTFDRFRARLPEIAIRTTVIAGYPGETDDDIDSLCAFLEEADVDYCGVFAYSAEEGTHAATLEHQLDEMTIQEHAQRVQDVSEYIGFAHAAAHIGKVYRVLIDGVDEGEQGTELIGRTWFQSPDDIDGVVRLPEVDAQLGDFIDVRITDAVCYDLIGVPLDKS